jgi:methylated-DNA-[protein]-cysteine S-methyltransferase
MTATICYCNFESPVGRLLIEGDGQFVTGLYLPSHKDGRVPEASWRHSDSSFVEVREQLAEYFAGERQQFDLPLKLVGTPFQQRVWQELQQIPFGTTITYAELAGRIGKPAASRAVGNANGCNPVSIIVPCHRVIGSNGKLTGYAGGIDKKEWLLDWECRALAAQNPSKRTLGIRSVSVPANL